MSDQPFAVTHDGDIAILRLAPTLMGRVEVHDLVDSLLKFVESDQPKKLCVNFEEVTRFNSEAIGGLIRANRRILESEGRLALCGMHPTIRMIFTISRLDGSIFNIHDRYEDAKAALNSPVVDDSPAADA